MAKDDKPKPAPKPLPKIVCGGCNRMKCTCGKP